MVWRSQVFILLALFIGICFVQSVSAVECNADLFGGNGSSCTISSNLFFNVTQDFYINVSGSSAISFAANNIHLDCNGSTINGNYTLTTGSDGIITNGRDNLTISNCNVKGYYRNINLKNTENSSIINITAFGGVNNFYAENVQRTSFYNLYSYDSIAEGFYLLTSLIDIYINNYNANNSGTKGFRSYGSTINFYLNNSYVFGSSTDGFAFENNNTNLILSNITSSYNNVNFYMENLTNVQFLNLRSLHSRSSVDGSFADYTGGKNVLVDNFYAYNTSGHGIANKYMDGFILRNSYFEKIGNGSAGGYGIDFYGGGNNITIYNNTIITANNGIVFSMADDRNGTNILVYNNTVSNIHYYGIYFNGITNGTSIDNKLNNITIRCFSVSTGSYNINVVGGECNNSLGYYLLTNVNSYEVLFDNVNNNNDFNNISVSDSNVTFYNLPYKDYSVFQSNGIGLSYIFLYNQTNALIYNTNGSIYGSSNIADNDGNINITLTPNNASYVLDDYNWTLGVTRENDPLFNGTFINNTLNEAITVRIYGITTLRNARFTNGARITPTQITVAPGDYSQVY